MVNSFSNVFYFYCNNCRNSLLSTTHTYKLATKEGISTSVSTMKLREINFPQY